MLFFIEASSADRIFNLDDFLCSSISYLDAVEINLLDPGIFCCYYSDSLFDSGVISNKFLMTFLSLSSAILISMILFHISV
jgi:hypothetical protein